MSYALAAPSSSANVPMYFLTWSTFISACQLELFLETPMYLDLLLRCFLWALLAFFGVEVNPVTHCFRMLIFKSKSPCLISSSLVFLFLLVGVNFSLSICACLIEFVSDLDRLVCIFFCTAFMSDAVEG
ncbi:unnamed protein product [Moneuplotes crassus]|uniref:Uncharacterized protein n=1 Tax=Euplotes crassus TaxID=5936 RepID=A0AAD1UTM6_EUPCR|nr:unnamed protein product [Moneuplotes crassus]